MFGTVGAAFVGLTGISTTRAIFVLCIIRLMGILISLRISICLISRARVFWRLFVGLTGISFIRSIFGLYGIIRLGSVCIRLRIGICLIS